MQGTRRLTLLSCFTVFTMITLGLAAVLSAAEAAKPVAKVIKPAAKAAKPSLDEPADAKQPKASQQKVHWLNDYAKAMTVAEQQHKMMLLYFCDCGDDSSVCNRFRSETLDDPQVRAKLQDYVCVQVPLAAKITVGGKPVVLIEHEAFGEMLGRPGVAIIDFQTADAVTHGAVVSEFPITESLWYTPEQMTVILTLPSGTLTQRTLIFAVRTHPEKPASTEGELLPLLREEAQNHSQYQADIRLQGHHFWESRFQRIVARLPGGSSAEEVCAKAGRARTSSRRPSSASIVGGSPPATGTPCGPTIRSSATT